MASTARIRVQISLMGAGIGCYQVLSATEFSTYPKRTASIRFIGFRCRARFIRRIPRWRLSLNTGSEFAILVLGPSILP